MNDSATPLMKLLEQTSEYGNTSIKLFKLNTINKVAGFGATFFSYLLVFTIFALSFLFLNIGFSLWLGEQFGNNYYGFFSVAFIHAVLTILTYIIRNRFIKHPLSNIILRELLKQTIKEEKQNENSTKI